jgi:two-component system chemotaxis sensor kinase CheA
MNPDIMAKLVVKFAGAAQDRLERLNNGLLILERSPDNEEIIDEVMREIHTLKGESKMLGLASATAVAHMTEDFLATAKENNFTGDACDFDAIYDGVDLLDALIKFGAADPDDAVKQKVVAYLCGQHVPFGWAHGAESKPEAQANGQTAAEVKSTPAQTVDAGAANTDAEVAVSVEAEASVPANAVSARGGEKPGAMTSSTFLHVATEQMETLTRLGGDLQLLHADSERLSNDLSRLVTSCRDTLPRAREIGASAGDRDALMSHVIALYDEMDAHLHRFRDASFQSRVRVGELQEEVSSARMQELSLLLQKYPRAVRDLGKELGKKVHLNLDDGGIAADDNVLRALADPLLHVIRNAVDHGIESTAERVAAGKPEDGTISIIASRQGTRIQIRVEDDGGGIDADVIRKTAISRGAITEAEAAVLGEAESLLLVLRAGFSTAKVVTDVSGRGVGLDVVRTGIERLGGTVRVESEVGKGSSFILTVPTTVALTPVLVVQVEQGQFGIPSRDVASVVRITSDKLDYHAGTYSLRLSDDHRIPMLSLAGELGFSGVDSLTETVQAVIIGSGSSRIAFRVRRLVGERPAVQTSLNPLLARYKEVTGSAIIGGGEVLPILNTSRLLESTRTGVHRANSGGDPSGGEKPATTESQRLRVLIVEDSDLTREMLISATTRLGYETDDAANGRQGVEQAKAKRPDIIMTDLDMPVLNGFGLIAELRQDPSFDSMPIVVLSTRSGDEDKRQATEKGADDYLAKAQFSDWRLGDFLLNAIAARKQQSNAA